MNIDKLQALAKECGGTIVSEPSRLVGVAFKPAELAAFTERVRQEERERCAAICREMKADSDCGCQWMAGTIEASILSQTEGQPK